MSLPVICFVGRSKVGKTTLLEKLIVVLKNRGYRVAVIKHHHQAGANVDHPGKDTWRYAQAGSQQVVLVAPDKVFSVRHLNQEPTLDEIVATINDVDLILVEGYKKANKPKIELVRAARSQTLVCPPASLFALVSDLNLTLNIPCFSHNQIEDLADLIENHFLVNSE